MREPKPWWLLIPVLGVSAAVGSWRWYGAAIRRAKEDGTAGRVESMRGVVYWTGWGILAVVGLSAHLHGQLRKGTPPSAQPKPSTADEPVERGYP